VSHSDHGPFGIFNNHCIMTTDISHVPLLRRAYETAWRESPDPDTKNGALIITAKGEMIEGANTLPLRVKILPERLARPDNYNFIEHAERNAIYAAASWGISPVNAVMYVPWYACVDCARAIINVGIRTVIGHKAAMDKTPERWRLSIRLALEMLSEAGVQLMLYDGQVGGVDALFDREIWHP